MYSAVEDSAPGIAALLALNPNESMRENLKKAGKAARSVKTGEVTFAARNGKFGKHVMREGDIIGLVDGRVEAVGENSEEVLGEIVRKMVGKNHSVVTVYYGEDIDDSTAAGLQDMLEACRLTASVRLRFTAAGNPYITTWYQRNNVTRSVPAR